MPEYLTVASTAERLNISRVKVYDLLRSGELASFKIGRCRRIPAESVVAYVDAQLKAVAGDAA